MKKQRPRDSRDVTRWSEMKLEATSSWCVRSQVSAMMLPGSGVCSITAYFVISSLFLVSLCLNSLIFKMSPSMWSKHNGVLLNHKSEMPVSPVAR